jgi:hypothetical protein
VQNHHKGSFKKNQLRTANLIEAILMPDINEPSPSIAPRFKRPGEKSRKQAVIMLKTYRLPGKSEFFYR